MAFTQATSYEVKHATEKFLLVFNKVLNENTCKRKKELMTRRFFPLSEIKAEKRNDKEWPEIYRKTVESFNNDYKIYEELRDILVLGKMNGSIFVNPDEANFIIKYTVTKNEQKG